AVARERERGLVEEPDTGPKEELGFVTGHDQEKSNVVGFAAIDRRAPRAEDLEQVRPADSTLVERPPVVGDGVEPSRFPVRSTPRARRLHLGLKASPVASLPPSARCATPR